MDKSEAREVMADPTLTAFGTPMFSRCPDAGYIYRDLLAAAILAHLFLISSIYLAAHTQGDKVERRFG
jgi:hypothetical protein